MYLKQLPMSYKASTRTNNRDNKTKQPFCKVCFDAKRNDYNTHFLKDFSGSRLVVLCPYLLALQCNYCKEQGHTVSYCEVLKAKNAGEGGATKSSHRSKETSQNGNFFILRMSKDKETTITHASRESISQKKPVSTTNQFALLEDDDEEWEMPKYNKTKKSVSFSEAETAVAIAEPVSKVEAVEEEASAFPSWAKIVATMPKKTTPVLSSKDALKKDVASIFVTARAEPADFEKPMPTFIHSVLAVETKSAVETKPASKSTEKYFFAPPSNRSWADDSSEEDGW